MKALYKQGLRGRKVRQHFPDGMEVIPTATLIRRVYRIAVLPILRNYCMGFTVRKCEDSRMTGKCPKCGEICDFIFRHSITVNGKAIYPKKAKAFRIPKCDCSEKKIAGQ